MNDLQKLIDKVIDKAIVGCDTYKYVGSTWLLFTVDKKWVIELTKEGTLWYNYYFFQKLFKVIALDVVENQHCITKWVEEIIQNEVKHTEYGDWLDGDERLDDIIKNGVKETHDDVYHHTGRIEGVIKNGVKQTKYIDYSDNTEFIVDGVISRKELVLNKTST